jgi:hypothetical protein
MDISAAIRADDAARRLVTNPRRKQKIWRGETRNFDRTAGGRDRLNPEQFRVSDVTASSPHDMYRVASSAARQAVSASGMVASVGQHWSASRTAPMEFAKRRRGNTDLQDAWGTANVIWHGELDDPDFQIDADGRGEHGYGSSHWEREIRLRPGVPVRVTGASVHLPPIDGSEEPSYSGRWHHFSFGARFPIVGEYGSSRETSRNIHTYAAGLDHLGIPETAPERHSAAEVLRQVQVEQK